MRPVAPRPIALTATARLAARRSPASSRTAGRGKAAAGSRRPDFLCTVPGCRSAPRRANLFVHLPDVQHSAWSVFQFDLALQGLLPG